MLRLVSEGLSNRAIASRLRISEQAVKQHVSKLLLVYGVRNRAALVRTATDLIARQARDATIAGLLARAPVLATVTSGPEHVVEFANARVLEYVGGRPITGPEARRRRRLPRELKAVFDRTYTSGEPFTDRTFVLRGDLRADGHVEERVFDLLVYPRRDVRGEVDGLVVIAVDVTDCARGSNASGGGRA